MCHTYIQLMNRREFAKSLAALGLAPALPALSASAAQSAGFTPYMYGLGAHLARSKGGCSAALLAQKLGLAPEVAQAMQAQLVRNGVVTTSSTGGLAAAAQPYMRSAPAAMTAVTNAWKSLHRIAEGLEVSPEAVEEETLSREPTAPEDQP